MSDNRIPVAILGATGNVGQRFIELLQDHPWFRVAELVASDRSAGKKFEDATVWRIGDDMPDTVRDMTVLNYDADLQSPIAFSGLPGDVASDIEARLAAGGAAVVSNSAPHRMDPDVPLLIPEVNPDHLEIIKTQQANRGWKGFITTNSNCSTMHVAITLKPLQDAFGLKKVLVTTLQAVSGAGYPGVPSMDMIDNVVPFIGGEEEKMESEAMKMLGTVVDGAFQEADFVLSAHCNRVPVRDGHTECASIELGRDVTPEEVIEVFQNFRGVPQELELPSAPKRPIVVRSEDNRPQPILDRNTERGMASVVGRIRPCPVLGLKYVLLGHNTVRGAAGAGILNAELLKAKGLLNI